MPIAKRSIVIFATLMAAFGNACGGVTPTSPTPTSSGFALRGLVTGYEGAALPGAILEILDGANKGQRVVTDVQGRYGLTGLQPGGFTIQASAVDYATTTRPVTLTADSSLDFPLRVLLAQMAIIGTITPLSHSNGTFGAQFQIVNTGDGCAADVAGTADFFDMNRMLVISLAWSAPATPMFRPGDRSTFEFCCLTREQAAAITQYNSNFRWVTVHCT
jgi:hypothetical protein